MFQKVKGCTAILLFSNRAFAEWVADFQPHETLSNTNLESSIVTLQWMVTAGCSVTSIAVFIFAGWKHANGDLVGSLLSFCGAILIAIAPFLTI